MVLLGTPTAESSEIYALTVSTGDPTWAGPLAGTSLGLPVFHILEPEVKEQIPPDVYTQQVGLSEMVLETELIINTMRQVREQAEAAN